MSDIDEDGFLVALRATGNKLDIEVEILNVGATAAIVTGGGKSRLIVT